MSKDNYPKFTWDPQTGKATCTITDGHNLFTGTAICHPDDLDMISEKTGCMIAQIRAEIKYYIHSRDNDILPCLKVLKHTYNCMKQSSHFSEKSNESRLMRRQIRQQEFDLIVVRQLLTERKQQLKTFLEEKDKFYKKVRSLREHQSKEDLVGQDSSNH